MLIGDGIGKDVMDAAKLVLQSIPLDAEYVYGDIGWEFWKKEGNPLPDRTLDMLKQTDACLLGAITSKPKDEAENELNDELKGKGFNYYSPVVKLRQELVLHTNIRPCKSYKGNPLNYKDEIDIIVFRENTEGLYSGVEFHPIPKEVMEVLSRNNSNMKKFSNTPLDEIAISTRIMTKRACVSILIKAFEYAERKGYNDVTVIEKPNILRETGALMIGEARRIAKDFPNIKLWERNIDSMCMWLLKDPLQFSILVAENMFGDIISDLCAQLVGGLGFAPSGNIGNDYAMFEPTHGSAPKYSGQYKVNPIATILSIKMLLDYLGEEDMAIKLEEAVAHVVKEGKVRTYDMGGNNSTLEVANEIAYKMKTLVRK
jgi:isocitrate/isopropylmalate dehydrogenase